MPLDEWARDHEMPIRLGVFFFVFALIALAEIVIPRRKLTVAKTGRWASNLALVASNTIVLRLLFPTAALGTAALAEASGFGLLPASGLPTWALFAIAVVAMDLAIYFQHILFHAVPLLWRLHQVHHADLDFDVTTGARFHPIEMVLSMITKLAVVALLGASAAAVVAFEVLLSATAIFNHSNLRLPVNVDRWLRWLVVTPDMHRVHHSVEVDEANTNFGFSLPWWDRLFATYRAQPRAGHEAMTIGLRGLRDPSLCNRLPSMLFLPFSKRTSYAINRAG